MSEDTNEAIVIGINGDPPNPLRKFPVSQAGYNAASEFLNTLEGVQEGRYYFDAPERFINPPVTGPTGDVGAARVIFRPIVTVGVGGTMGEMSVLFVEIDWEESCHGVLRDGKIVHQSEGGSDALISNFASSYLDDEAKTGAAEDALSPE